MLHIYFKETDGDAEDSLVWVLFDIVENMLYCTRNYSELILSPSLFLILSIIPQWTSIVVFREILVQISLAAEDSMGLS